MNHSAQSAILLSGWLLMAPPPTFKSDGTLDTLTPSAPISKWMQMGAYDTAKECQEALSDRIRTLDTKSKKLHEGDEATHTIVIQTLAGKCVPTESVYPPSSN